MTVSSMPDLQLALDEVTDDVLRIFIVANFDESGGNTYLTLTKQL